MISLNNARLMRGELVLLEQASLAIHNGQKIGVIGRNGSGKTSLFSCLQGHLALDQGDLNMPDGMRCAVMLQETAALPMTALDYVIDGDKDFRAIEKQLQKAEAAGNGEAIAHWHSELDRIGAYDIQARGKQLLAGLGFSTEEFAKPVANFSGGWRIRLNLAAALMAPSDLLLLDEPTNHLDLEATIWLEQWLKGYQGTLLVISHDRSFLDKVIDYVVSFEQQKLALYRGNYSSYESQRAARMAQEQAMFEKQQRRKAEIEDFVRRFRAKATKAKQAQSRLKELDRMQEIAPAHIDSPFRFEFPPPEHEADELLAVHLGVIGFSEPLISKIKLTIRANTRIGLLGFNGSGKSTLLKTLAGKLPLLAGEMRQSKHLKIGYFAQHQVDVLDKTASPMALIQKLDPLAREQVIRDFLGGFDFRGDRITENIANFSGGEKARLALALIVWQKPNVLLLDEPTNHLDLEMRHALTVALQGYAGALLIVSHDRHLLTNTVDEFYSVHQGRFTEFEGDLSDYEKWLQENSRDETTPVAKDSGADNQNSPDRKELRQQAAAQRQQLAPLRQEIRHLEKEMEKLNIKLQAVEVKLADPTMYEDAKRKELTELILEQGQLKTSLLTAEEQWMAKSETLEELSG